MSAFIVPHDHIDALVTYCVSRRIDFWNHESKTRTDINTCNAEEIGRMLLDENVRSVGYRYGGRLEDEEKNAAASYCYRPYTQPLSAVQVIKAVQCLEYQCCETDNWEASLTWRICQEIKSRVSSALPGYDDAMWVIERERQQ